MTISISVQDSLHLELLGITDKHVAPLPEDSAISLHGEVVGAWAQLRQAADQAGFDLRIASGFRNFERQRLIWNAKCRGKQSLFDRKGEKVEISQLSSADKIKTILYWSALPGTSRHHWGTDCDIYDAAAISASYQLQLHPNEYRADGPFAPMMAWLVEYLKQPGSPEFFQPYYQLSDKASDSYGVAPVPWHISYRPVAKRYVECLSVDLLRQFLTGLPEEYQLDEQAGVLESLDVIVECFVKQV